ncbi:MAG: ATP-binding protein [Eubacteriales bacterium]
MKKRLSNQFLSNYLIVFLLTIIATVLTFAMITFASGLISKSLVKNKYTAASVIREDYKQIDASEVVRNGGGIQVVDKDYNVIYNIGLDTIGKDKLSAGEFTDFLINSKDKPYHYDILYQPKGEFWLIVTFPTSLRFNFSLVYNKDAPAGDFRYVGGVLITAVTAYLLLLALFTLVFSRISAASITIPLRKLCDGTKLLREGDYSARVDLRLKNEFAELQSTFNDMAQRIEHEMALRKKSENDRRRLILDISHDLKNPLSGIQGYAELCVKNPQLSERERTEYLKTIQNNSIRANLLLSELFELSQMDDPDFTIKPIKTDICEYLRQICADLVPHLENEGMEYAFDIPETPVFALLDVNRFNRIFQNLADNAVRYNPKGTMISIILVQADDRTTIYFKDNGCGIPSCLSEDIFKPFVRADQARNSKTGGSGLGLSIAKKIAQVHGGDISLSSGSGGSTFILTVPSI